MLRKFSSKRLDGHPTPATPFVPAATGASGVGLGLAAGLALGARDAYGPRSPRVHVIEGEGGLTPGRVQETLAAAATMGLDNLIVHVDWNQSSIDSDAVCAKDGRPGDYVQWNPLELFYFHDWNVIDAGNGHDWPSVLSAQKLAGELRGGQPTAVVYRTTKGWRYGIEGRKTHGAGHSFCGDEFYKALASFEERFRVRFARSSGLSGQEQIEGAHWETLQTVRKVLESRRRLTGYFAGRVRAASAKCRSRDLKPRGGSPRLDLLHKSNLRPDTTPPMLVLKPGQKTTLRGALGQALGHINELTGGALLGCAADLLDSTSLSPLNKGFAPGFYHARHNPKSRLVAVGGICEDAMGALMAGVSTYGRHIGVTSSYSSFIAPLEHVAARLHAIAQQAREHVLGEPYRTWIMVNAHAGPKTGEDGSTHADPQALQLLQNNFPHGTLITLTPWDPQEVWPLLAAGLARRPAVLAPFLTRPTETVPDRAALRLPPACAAKQGVYCLRRGRERAIVILQGSASAYAFIEEVLPRLNREGPDVSVFYVASAELFDMLPQDKRELIFPSELAYRTMGITDFTLPTMWRWVRSEEGLRHCLHPFRAGRYLGSGQYQMVLKEAGLDGASQYEAIERWGRLIGKKYAKPKRVQNGIKI